MGKREGVKVSDIGNAAELEDEFPDPFPNIVARVAEILLDSEIRTADISLSHAREILAISWPSTCQNVDRLRKVFEARGLVWSSATLAGEIEKLRAGVQDYAGGQSVDEFTDAWLAMGASNALSSPRPTIVSHGDQCYSIGGGLPYRVEDREHRVLQAFVFGPNAQALPDLKKNSGEERPHEVLRNLGDKYDGAFAPAIRLPGGRGLGGYAVSIRTEQ